MGWVLQTIMERQLSENYVKIRINHQSLILGMKQHYKLGVLSILSDLAKE